MLSKLVLSIVALTLVKSELVFPKSFLFGAGSAAYQVEGAWNEDGKGESNWDHRTHNYPKQIMDSSNGDVACDSYHKFKEDIQILRDLGVNAHRFSLSWSRILPEGFSHKINLDGIKYYNNLINELLKYNITPVVTIFHMDLPYSLTLIGGWTNEALVDYFTDYARIVFENFGDRVKIWTSFNAPHGLCSSEYSASLSYLNLTNAEAPYLCGHTILKAHAKVYKLLKGEFRSQNGKIGLSMDGAGVSPASDSLEDKEAAARFPEFELHWFAHPVYSKYGDYSPYLKDYLGRISKQENFPRSKLPEFTAREIEEIRGSYDFLGLNFYGPALVLKCQKLNVKPSYENDVDVDFTFDPSWKLSEAGVPDFPQRFYNYLILLKKRYNNPPIFVMENGYAEAAIQDTNRLHYHKGHLQALSDSLRDGVNVIGYFVWSLLDNFEWYLGYTIKYGLYQIDFTNATRPRTPRQTALWYKDFIHRHKTRNNLL